MVKFEKVLYRPQPYPDNYTDRKLFLNSLERNSDLTTYRLSECVFQGQFPLQQLSCTISFLILHLINIRITDVVLYAMALVTIASYLYLTGLTFHQLKTALLFSGFLFALSPIIQTLTSSISNDTIYAMVAICFLTNLALHDYTSSADSMSKCVSLNAAIFAAVCLASRHDNTNSVLATIILGIFIYGVLPPIVRREEERGWLVSGVTLLTTSLSLYLTYSYYPLMTVSLLVSIASCLLIVPALFIRLQKQKDNIYGPWDEAVLKDCMSAERDISAE